MKFGLLLSFPGMLSYTVLLLCEQIGHQMRQKIIYSMQLTAKLTFWAAVKRKSSSNEASLSGLDWNLAAFQIALLVWRINFVHVQLGPTHIERLGQNYSIRASSEMLSWQNMLYKQCQQRETNEMLWLLATLDLPEVLTLLFAERLSCSPKGLVMNLGFLISWTKLLWAEHAIQLPSAHNSCIV